jgi:hypothetical protein
MVWFGWVIALHPQTLKHIIGAAGIIILTPANQLIVTGLKIWSLSNPGSTSDLLLTDPRAYQLL